MKYQNSKFTSLQKVNPKAYCLSHSITQEQIYGDERLLEIYKFLKSKKTKEEINFILKENYRETNLFDILKSKKFIIPETLKKESIETYRPNNFKAHEEGYRLLRILLTDICNLNCKYCKVMPNIVDVTRNSTPLTKLEESIKFFFSKSREDKPKIIHLSGGEPTVCWEKIEEIVNIVNLYKRKNEKYFICLGTNAILLNKEKAVFIKDNDIKVIVSLDGRKKANDRLRVKHNGKGTFDEIVKAIDLLKDYDVDFGISMVIGKHNILTLEKEINFIIKKFNPISLGINFMKPPTKEDIDFPYLISPKEYVDKIYDIYKKYRHTGVYFELLYRKLEPFVKQYFRYQDCGATAGTTINIDARGKIGPCKSFLVLDEISCLSSETNEIKTIEEVLRELEKRSPINYKKCQNCEAIGICGNGCAYEAWIESGDLLSIDQKACQYSKLFYSKFIKDLYNLTKEKITKLGYYLCTPNDRDLLFGNVTIDKGNLNSSIGHETNT